jgi:hypothetical protein
MAKRTNPPNSVPEHDPPTEAEFRKIVETAKPVVFRRLVSEWPAVKAAAESVDALADYLSRFDRGQAVIAVAAPAAAGGRLFYNDDLSGFNFRRVETKLADALRFFKQAEALEKPETLAIQSIGATQLVPGFEVDNPLDIFGQAVEPRLWIGNAAIVAAHYDASENLACSVAGRRRFTLFPPEQVANLYPGPIEHTPAGAVISMVDFDQPDLERFPRFPQAMAAAWIADLEPGDAIYIPYLWWHHVRSTEQFNMLVNYWPRQSSFLAPNAALMAAILAMKGLSRTQRAAWSEMFDHFAFAGDGDVAEHLPPDRRGVLGRLTPRILQFARDRIRRSIAPPVRGAGGQSSEAKAKERGKT